VSVVSVLVFPALSVPVTVSVGELVVLAPRLKVFDA